MFIVKELIMLNVPQVEERLSGDEAEDEEGAGRGSG